MSDIYNKTSVIIIQNNYNKIDFTNQCHHLIRMSILSDEHIKLYLRMTGFLNVPILFSFEKCLKKIKLIAKHHGITDETGYSLIFKKKYMNQNS